MPPSLNLCVDEGHTRRRMIASENADDAARVVPNRPDPHRPSPTTAGERKWSCTSLFCQP